MISKRIKAFFNIPQEFPVIGYFKDHWKLFHSNPSSYTRDQFFKRYKFYPSLQFEKSVRFHQSGSKVPIDIFIPTLKKDLEILPYVVEYARRNIMHPVNKVYIVAPPDNETKELAEKSNCVFVDERTVLGYGREMTSYHFDGIDASGWILQQLLKLNCHTVCEMDHILVLDSDLIIINPQKFEHKGKYILEFSDEFHPTYFETYEKLMNEEHKMPVSFITHHMLFRRDHLISLQQHIERIHQERWDKAIIGMIPENKGHFFSEYETYSNFVLNNIKDSYIFEYWFNTVLSRNKLKDFDGMKDVLKKKYKMVTFPGYFKE